jgi:hypothetical protein
VVRIAGEGGTVAGKEGQPNLNVDGQLDVFEVLELIEKDGLVPGEKRKRPKHARGELKWEIEGVEAYKFTVTVQYCGHIQVVEFYSQIECWAYVKGWENCLACLRA